MIRNRHHPVLGLWIGLVALGLAFSGGARASGMVLTEANDGQTVSVSSLQTFQVELPGNASTGYAWQVVETNTPSVMLSGPVDYIPDPSGLPGAGGTYSFAFNTEQPGSSTLHFRDARPWDPTDYVKSFTVTILVTASPVGPRLRIALQEGQAHVTWPVDGSDGFYLEGAPALTNWAAVNVAVMRVGTNFTAAFPISGRSLFLRLRR